MRKQLRFSTHKFAGLVLTDHGNTQTCSLLARHLSREGDSVLIREVGLWVRGQYPDAVVALWCSERDPYFSLTGDKQKHRLALARRLLRAPNRRACITRKA